MNKTRLILSSILSALALAYIFLLLPKGVGANGLRTALKTKLAAQHRSVSIECPEIIGSNRVEVSFIPYGEAPEWMAFALKEDDSGESEENPRDFDILDNAKWVPFITNMVVDLGPGDGNRELYYGFKYKGEPNFRYATMERVLVRTDKPVIVISSPEEDVTSQPMVQVVGFINKDASSIHYSIFDEKGRRTASGVGLVNDRYFDKSSWQFSTSYFTCYDVDLSPGTNRFVIECKDTTGFSGTTNFQIAFTTLNDTNPPNFKLDWPKDGAALTDPQLTMRGPIDDPTATIGCWVTDDEGHTESQNGFSERNGYLWIEHLPLKRVGRHQITIVASDVAGNSSWTNLIVSRGTDILQMDPISGIQPVWKTRIDLVTGFSSRTNGEVFVNGVKAEMQPDGHWTARHVPVNSANENTATLHLRIEPPDTSAETNTWIPTAFGKEKEWLAPASSMLQIGTNEYDHYTVSLGFTNVSGEDIRGKWMLPVEDARLVLHLYDSSNNEVPTRTYLLKKSYGKSLPTNLNIHHLQKRDYEQIGGVIDFPKASATRTLVLKMDDYLQMPAAGDYRLEIVPQLFRIADNGRLVPTEFPAVKTILHVRDQDSQLVFSLKKLQQQGRLAWSATTNSLSVGLAQAISRSDHSIEIQAFIYNSASGVGVTPLLIPTQNEAFRIELYDSAGNPVPKTALGKQTGQPVSLMTQRSRGWRDALSAMLGFGQHRQRPRRTTVATKNAEQCLHFRLLDYFRITTPGKYRLFYEQRLYGWTTNSQTPITMPSVTLPIEIQWLPEN